MNPLQVFVTDMNVGFSQNRDGAMFSPRVAALVPPTAEFIRSLPAGSKVVFVSDCHQPGDAEHRRFPVHCVDGSGDEKVHPDLIKACEESGIGYVVIYKSEHDVFAGTEQPGVFSWHPFRKPADAGLVRKHIVNSGDEWVVIGCVTDICIDINVASLTQRGKRVTVVRNLIDTYDLPLSTCRELGLPDAAAHDPEEVNQFWFSHRFPVTWGARVVGDWRELV